MNVNIELLTASIVLLVFALFLRYRKNAKDSVVSTASPTPVAAAPVEMVGEAVVSEDTDTDTES